MYYSYTTDEEDREDLDWIGGCSKTSKRIMCHAPHAGENFCDPTISNIWPLNCPDSILLDYLVEQESSKTLSHTEGEDNSKVQQFKQGDRQRFLQEIPKSSGDQLRFLWRGLIYRN